MEKAGRTRLLKIRKLMRSREERDAEGLFVAEGLKIVSDMMRKGHVPESIIVSRDFAGTAKNRKFLRDITVPVFVADDADFNKVSSLQSTQGILAVAVKPRFSKRPIVDKGRTRLILCDGIQDPGNLGAIIRISAAFEADSVLLMGETADIYNSKVVRASSGTVLDMPVYDCSLKELDRFREAGYRLLVGRSQKKESENIITAKNSRGPVILAFGSEGKGISSAVSGRADGFFYIPISKKVESLNVASAVAISLYVFSVKH